MAVSVRTPPTGDADRASAVEARTQAIGRDLIAAIQRQPERPMDWLQDRFLVAIAEDETLRTSLLRFIDVLAALDFDRGGELTARLAREYLQRPLSRLPAPFRLIAEMARSAPAPARLIRLAAVRATTAIADRFIVEPGERSMAGGATRALRVLRREGRVPSFDVLGEHVAGDDEAAAYLQRYLDLIAELGGQPEAGSCTAGGVRSLQVSVKLSALAPIFDPVDPEGTLNRVRGPLERIVEAAASAGVAVTIDVEEYRLRDLTWHIVRSVFGATGRFHDWPDVGVVLQAYLADAPGQLQAMRAFAAERTSPVQVRLVKGAYWDYEHIIAEADGWPSPVLAVKAATDVQFERLTWQLAEAYPRIRLAVGSHNVRSHASSEAVREALGLPEGAIEHQTLFGMAPRVSRALRGTGWVARDYVPVGDLLAGMGYLVRRILENSSQTGFLLQSRGGAPLHELLRNPATLLGTEPVAAGAAAHTTAEREFRNSPPVRLFLSEERDRFASAVAQAEQSQGRHFALDLPPTSGPRPMLRPLNPSSPDPARPAVEVEAATMGDVGPVLARLRDGAESWGRRPLAERAGILRRAGDLLLSRRDQLAAAIVIEGGKNWANALGDVDEAVDYLRYYPWLAGRMSRRLETDSVPRGIVAVIPPWNFPLAIPCGMTTAALITGNAVVLKPAEQTPGITARLVQLLREAGVPRDVIVHLPGDGETIGGALVSSPLVDMVAFTGSRDVGAWIAETAAGTITARGRLKHVLAEMGGKNAIAVFPDADLDEAVEGILQSAFGHANQKCSAVSRVFAHRDIYARLRRRLVEGARSLPVGAATDAGTFINPLIDAAAMARVRELAGVARQEGRVVLDRLDRTPPYPGYGLGPLIVELSPTRLRDARTAQDEIFGPVLVLAPYRSEQEALALINDTVYGLTAGIFSRSPATIRRMAAGIRAGNIYVNREITGARVGVEPFGGMGMSGAGPKAGGEDYLYAFVSQRASAPREGGAASPALPANESTVAGRDAGVAWPTVTAWSDPANRRAKALAAADRLLTTGDAGPAPASLNGVLSALSRQVAEIREAQPTNPIPGQQTSIDWSLPRGIGGVVLDERASPETLAYLVGAALLAGNGIVVATAPVLHGAARALVQALRRSGVPAQCLALLEGTDIPDTVPPGRFDFIAADVALPRARRLAASLARRYPGQRNMPAFLSEADGPGLDEPGFLRRFALPRTIAIRTLRHGADLAL